MARLGRYFTLEEFQRASDRPLTLAEQTRAAEWVRVVLDDARDFYGGPLLVTSYVRGRETVSAHRNGSGVDLQPLGGTDADVRRLADYIAAKHRPPSGFLAQVIYEPPEGRQSRAHVHLASELPQGATPGYLHEKIVLGERKYFREPIPAAPLYAHADPVPEVVGPPQDVTPLVLGTGLLLFLVLS